PAGINATNVALGKPAYQSSVQPHEILGSAEKAVDGNCSGNWSQGSCIRTKHEAQPWWYVDLGDSYKISVVVVKNPEDCCRELINHLEVRVGDTLENHGRSNAPCGIIPFIRLGSISTFFCNGQKGRYVSVHLPGVNSLVVCEVEVVGTL
uniref:Fucolectin tachylectin-4 pentraxin-1 domain-containing protein n=1 Tax=Naja naja TaxID=35670 RepID=A0A8C6XVF1_NAJNA